jgi:hypothetical protein
LTDWHVYRPPYQRSDSLEDDGGPLCLPRIGFRVSGRPPTVFRFFLGDLEADGRGRGCFSTADMLFVAVWTAFSAAAAAEFVKTLFEDPVVLRL